MLITSPPCWHQIGSARIPACESQATSPHPRRDERSFVTRSHSCFNRPFVNTNPAHGDNDETAPYDRSHDRVGYDSTGSNSNANAANINNSGADGPAREPGRRCDYGFDDCGTLRCDLRSGRKARLGSLSLAL